MKIGNGVQRTVRVLIFALLVGSALGCPRKKVIFSLSPSSMLFSAPQDGIPPADQILTMTGIGEIPPNGATWELFSDQPWLTVTPTSGVLHADESLALTVHADQSFMAEGLYSGEVTIVARYGRHYYPQAYQVTLDVTAGQSPPPIVIPPDPESEAEIEAEDKPTVVVWTEAEILNDD